ncbi:hypothetical protein [Microvirga arabica]|uniref:hypothetical protein n=1 Tax=Microvirga arabica TaxID=1128671 RepID=UPI00193AC501|nr:hypothetical protein [Microvirga arabica]MBM1169337.1 hypothetical protein [Microvirga arabica]
MAQMTPDYIRSLDTAKGLVAALPESTANPTTHRTYLKLFREMWHEPVLDPLRPADAYDTYAKRRCALLSGGRFAIDRLSEKLEQALTTADPETGLIARSLDRLVARVTAALIRDGRLGDSGDGVPSGADRWRAVSEDRARRGAESKRYLLADLPDNWRERIWARLPADSPHRWALAVSDITGCRLADLVPGNRCGHEYAGATVCFEDEELVIYICPAKTTEWVQTRYVVDVEGCGAVAHELVARCRANDGQMTISIRSPDAVRKAIERLGRVVFPELEEAITPNVYRSQSLADAKAQWGAGEMVAIMAGHASDGTQSRYGRREHSTGRRALKAVSATREIKVGRVAHAQALGELRKGRSAKPHR